MPVFRLSEELVFPDPHLAEPDGLLAVGGDLSPERLWLAYHHGIFPWFEEENPILWWSPDPRMVLWPDRLRISKSMRQVLRQDRFRVTFDQDFAGVIRQCRTLPRRGQESTWITPEMIAAYTVLHELGLVHSVEVWADQALVGGLYGLAAGNCFCGESMFARESNASKVGFIHLVRWLKQHGFQLIDCQTPTPHLASLGGETWPRREFL